MFLSKQDHDASCVVFYRGPFQGRGDSLNNMIVGDRRRSGDVVGTEAVFKEFGDVAIGGLMVLDFPIHGRQDCSFHCCEGVFSGEMMVDNSQDLEELEKRVGGLSDVGGSYVCDLCKECL